MAQLPSASIISWPISLLMKPGVCAKADRVIGEHPEAVQVSGAQRDQAWLLHNFSDFCELNWTSRTRYIGVLGTVPGSHGAE